MKRKKTGRGISLLLAVVVLSGLLGVPASAAEVPSRAENWWDSLMLSTMQFNSDVNIPFLGAVCNRLSSMVSGPACPASDDHLHHGSTEISKEGGTDPTLGTYLKVRCRYCNDYFNAYSSDFETAYNDYSTNIQNTYGATNIGMNGTSRMYLYGGWTYDIPIAKTIVSTKIEYPYVSGIALRTSDLNFVGFNQINSPSFSIPASGNYRIVIPAPVMDGAVTSSRNYYYSVDLVQKLPSSARVYEQTIMEQSAKQLFVSNGFSFSIGLLSGNTYCFMFRFCMQVPDNTTSYSFSFNCPYVEGVQLFPADAPERDSGTRVGSISGNFGYMNNGTMVNVDNVQIVNEGDNTYYNPATGQTSTVTDWNYDYSTRSYNLSLAGGSTTTVTYGDENVTIKEGDTIYNIYYIPPEPQEPTPTPTPSASPSPTPGVCSHQYTEKITTPAGCLSAGVKTFTCSLCGNTKTEKIPATGHTWVLDRTINTTYDEEGNVLTQGYTIYKCSVCNTEYKDSDGAGPPGEEGGGGLSGLLDLILSGIGALADFVIGILTLIVERLGPVLALVLSIFKEVPVMFEAFTAFLAAVFPFLPPEVMTILIFGILSVVLVAIVRAFKK